MQKQFVDPFTQDSRRASEPAFEWDTGFSTSGASLVLEESERTPSPGGTVLQYRVTATGFEAGEPVELWWKRGTSYQLLPASVSDDGTVLVGGADVLAVAGLSAGQAVDLALASGEKRAQAKVIPFPIESREGNCWVTAELISESGRLFVITLGGFEPIETIEVTSEFESESDASMFEASEAGEVAFPVMFGKRDNGTAAIFAKGTSGSVSLQYEVGEDALTAR